MSCSLPFFPFFHVSWHFFIFSFFHFFICFNDFLILFIFCFLFFHFFHFFSFSLFSLFFFIFFFSISSFFFMFSFFFFSFSFFFLFSPSGQQTPPSQKTSLFPTQILLKILRHERKKERRKKKARTGTGPLPQSHAQDLFVIRVRGTPSLRQSMHASWKLTRLRESVWKRTLPKDHEDRIAGKGFCEIIIHKSSSLQVSQQPCDDIEMKWKHAAFA